MSFTGTKVSPDPVDQQLREVEDRLVAQYSGRDALSEQTVRQHFAEVRARFAQARIRSFLPILVERGVRARLTHSN